jgi:glycosyl transferase family 87
VGDRATRAVKLDIAIYVVCAVFAIVSAVWSEFYGYRIWGNFASVAYVFAAAHAIWLLLSRSGGGWLRSRWVPVGVVAGLGMIVPLGVLVIRRLTGTDWLITPWSWAAQPEVWVIERSAKLLFDTGTPYVDVSTITQVNDYTPYGPAMTVFGFPRALFGGGALTDARIMFAIAFVITIAASLRLLGWPKVPARAGQLAIASPLTALTFAVAGPDLAIIGLLILAGALASRDRFAWSATVLAVVVSMKLTALPAVVVIAFFVLAKAGRPALYRFVAAIVAMTAVLNIPVLIVQPGAFVEHVIKFPAGAGRISSPAASPFPGHLIASAGPVGHALALVLVGLTAVGLIWWMVVRPPKTGSDAMLKAAIVLGAALLVVPASRYGYLVYPLALWGAAMAFAVAERAASRPATSYDPLRGAQVGEPR